MIATLLIVMLALGFGGMVVYLFGIGAALPAAVDRLPLDNPYGDPSVEAPSPAPVPAERAEAVAAERRRLEQQIVARENPHYYEPLDPNDVIL